MDETDLEPIEIIIRPFDMQKDQAFIYSSWRNSYYSLAEDPNINSNTWFRKKSEEIKATLPVALVRVACYKDSHRTIVGYSVSTGTHLDFIYVKADFRKTGIGTLLMPKNIETVTSDLTKDGKVLAEKKNLKVKGEPYGRIERDKDPKETNPHLH